MCFSLFAQTSQNNMEIMEDEMKKALRILSLFFALSLFLSMVPIATASEIQPRFTYISDFRVSMSYENSAVTCKGRVVCPSSSTVKIICLFQKFENNSWVTKHVATDDGHPEAFVSFTKDATLGSTYRIHATATVMDSDGQIIERQVITEDIHCS